MNNSITKALLFVIALSTSIMAVQLIPISRKAYLFNLCRDYNAWWNESYLLADAYKSGNKKKKRNIVKQLINKKTSCKLREIIMKVLM